MKKITILAALALVFICASCNKSKNCRCTTTQAWDLDDMEPMVTVVEGTIDKGECSDQNATQHMTAGGQTYTATVDCVEI